MRILFTLTYFSPYVSGLTIHIKRLSKALAEKKYSITVLTSRHDNNLKIKEVSSKITIVRVPYLFRLHKGFVMPEYLTYALKQIKNNDIVTVNLPQVEALIVAILTKLKGKPLISIYHCELTLPDNITNRIIEKMMFIINYFILLLSDRIVTYTRDYASSSYLLKLFKKKTYYNYPPTRNPDIDEGLYNNLKSKIPNSAYYIGIAARFAPEKGFEYLIDALPYIESKLNKKIVLLIAGPVHPAGEESYWKSMQPRLNKYKKQIFFTDTIPDEKTGTFYKLIDILALPSVNSTEAFGIVQVEAMLCGIPVVASNLPGVRIPILKTGMGQLAEPGNVMDLAEKITNVLKLIDKYKKRQNLARKEFSYEYSIKKYEEIFKGIYKGEAAFFRYRKT